jgi:hypothetical protein
MSIVLPMASFTAQYVLRRSEPTMPGTPQLGMVLLARSGGIFTRHMAGAVFHRQDRSSLLMLTNYRLVVRPMSGFLLTKVSHRIFFFMNNSPITFSLDTSDSEMEDDEQFPALPNESKFFFI